MSNPSKELVESGRLIPRLLALETRIIKLESNQQETPVSSSEDDKYVLTSLGEADKYAEVELLGVSLKEVQTRKIELEAQSGSFTYRIARLVFLDEEKSDKPQATHNKVNKFLTVRNEKRPEVL